MRMTAIADHHRAGTGPPLLLVHGFASTWRTWGGLPQTLAKDFDVVAPTLAGHVGGPPLDPPRTIAALADHTERVLDELGWAQPHIAGFSLGGWIALEMAKRGRARSVTAVSPAGALLWCGDRETRRFQRQFRVNRALTRALLPLIDGVLGSAAMRRIALRDMMANGSRMPATEAALGLRDFAATPVFDEILDAFGREELTGLESIDVPVFVWWGRRDRILPVKHAPYFEEHLPQATFEYVDHAGHVPFWEAPDSVVAAIRRTAAAAGDPVRAS